MKITKITKRLGIVFNLGNYQTLKLETEVEAVVEPSDDPSEVNKKLYDTATEFIGQDKANILASRKKDADE